MSTPVNIVVLGATGRMGRLIATQCLEQPEFKLAGAITHSSSQSLGMDIGTLLGRAPYGMAVVSNGQAIASPAVLVDFSQPQAVIEHAQLAQEKGCGLVCGVSGLLPEHHQALEQASRAVPVLVAPNTSLSANWLGVLAALTAKALPDADIEICEVHHRNKRDSPSGTALWLAHMTGRPVCLDRTKGPRKAGEVGVFGLRGGSVAGRHQVHVLMDQEALVLSEEVDDRVVFAKGALKAAQFVAQCKKPGLYNMLDLFQIGHLLQH